MTTYTTPYGDSVTLSRSTYRYNNSLAVLMFCEDGEPYGNVTVNITDGIADDELAYVDTNNIPWLEKFLEKNKIAKPTGIVGFSGFCTYPLYKFNVESIPMMEEE